MLDYYRHDNRFKMISAEYSNSNGKIKVTKKLHSMVIFRIKARRSCGDLALKLTLREKIELEIVHVSIEMDVSL